MLRKVVTPKPTYSKEERDMVYAAIVFVAELLTQNGVNIIIDATANRRRYRDKAKKEIVRFMETYIRCPLELCIKREAERGKTFYAPKGIYRKAFNRKKRHRTWNRSSLRRAFTSQDNCGFRSAESQSMYPKNFGSTYENLCLNRVLTYFKHSTN